MTKKPVLNKEVWNAYSIGWAKDIAPGRPSTYEIDIYEDYVRKIVGRSKNKTKALVLGATPELRDMLAKYKIDVTLADINPNMFAAMDQLLEYSDGREKRILSSWLDIPLKDNLFDMILCDQGIHHIPFEKWDDFFQEQARLLKKGGHLIKGIVTVEQNEVLDVKETVADFKKHGFSREDKYYYNYRCFPGLKDIEGKLYFKHLQDLNIELKKFKDKKVITEKELRFLETPWGDFKVIFPPKEAVDKAFGKRFGIKSIRNSFINNVLTCHKIYFGQVKK